MSLVSEIKSCFTSHWELNDKGHRAPHFDAVYETALKIKKQLKLDTIPDDHIAVVAYFHDLFSWSRENHQELAEKFILTSENPILLAALPTVQDRFIVSKACLEHRSTYKGTYTGPLSELMSAADRGGPCEGDIDLDRSVHFHMAKGLTEHQARIEAVQHMKEKYGRNGYGRRPPLYMQAFGNELEAYFVKIDELRP